MTGNENVAIGSNALRDNTAGVRNLAFGFFAGNSSRGSNNIYFSNLGNAADNGTIRNRGARHPHGDLSDRQGPRGRIRPDRRDGGVPVAGSLPGHRPGLPARGADGSVPAPHERVTESPGRRQPPGNPTGAMSGALPDAEAHGAIRHAIRLHKDGKLDAAVDAYRAILERSPRAAVCWSNLGAALRKLGRRDDGLEALRRGERLCPGVIDVTYNLANALADAGDHEGALERYRAILRRDPDHLPAAAFCGATLLRLGRFEQAVEHHRAALDRHPDNAGFYHALGLSLWKLGRAKAAAAAYRRALAIGPAPSAWRLNLHRALEALGRYAEDERQLREAATQDAGSPGVLAALGQALVSRGRPDDALQYFDAALAAAPDHLDARLGRARANFLAGRYAAAWPDFRSRRRHVLWRAPSVTGRDWQGEDLRGRTILLYGEQGLGDVIQFVRYVPLVAQRGARVLLHCPPRLVNLLKRLSDVAEVAPSDGPHPRTDWVCPLLDVPGMFGTDLDSIPGACPYLPSRTPPRPLLPAARQFRIGIVWAGNPANPRDRHRSCNLDDFAPLLELPGAEFVSFQTGPRAAELRNTGWRGLIGETGDGLAPFETTADALAEVDLVITVDTAMAHLAGALGRPVWTLLSFAPDWRWLLGRIDTPWYPTMRLFRQPAPNDWTGAFREVRRVLAARLARVSRSSTRERLNRPSPTSSPSPPGAAGCG